jgi:hypothetical protein
VRVASDGAGLRTTIGGNVVLRVGLYYAVLAGAAWLAWRVLPAAVGARLLPDPPGAGAGLEALRGATAAPAAPSGARPAGGPWPAATAVVAMVSAVLLALPVAWVYVLTRAKRGYQQSVVQSLVILPLVVAGVVVLVKDSLALAFGLAGIVAAVRFRTAIDDSKDAVHIFLATGLGLAAAVNVAVAAAISVVFNGVILALWYADFGRTPAHLDGRVAERRLRRAMEQLSRTGTFVARIDDEVFREMSAEQLQAVADRAWRRARRNDPEQPDTEERREALLRVRTADVGGARATVEARLDGLVKRWRYGGVVHEADGTHVVEYVVLLRKGTPPDDVLGALRDGAPAVAGAELG